MPIDFDAVFQSEKARDSLYDLWYEALQEEANHVLTLTWSGGGMCSGENRVVEWNEMYFFLGDDGHVEEGLFKSLEDALPLVERYWLGWAVESLKPELYSDVLPFERLLRIARGLVEPEEDKVRINDKRFVLSGGELVEEPPTRR
jgi:hypothetical protein